jgi:hypothetical protein
MRISVSTGTWSIDWGDGVTNSGIASNTTQEHTYDFSDADLPAACFVGWIPRIGAGMNEAFGSRHTQVAQAVTRHRRFARRKGSVQNTYADRIIRRNEKILRLEKKIVRLEYGSERQTDCNGGRGAPVLRH